MGLGWAVGAGGVSTVNGIAPIAGDVSLGAADIPFAGALSPSTATDVEAQLVHGQTNLGTAKVFWDEITLDIVAPVVGSTHTFGQSVIMTPPISGAPITAAAGRDIDFPNPGSLTGIGAGGKCALVGNIDAPFMTGEVNLSEMTVGNMNTGASAWDVATTSTFGRLLRYTSTTFIGIRALQATNALGLLAMWDTILAPPPAAGVTGIDIKGTLGNSLGLGVIAIAPGSFDYTAWHLDDAATVSDLMIFDVCGVQSARAGDRLFDLSTLATVPAPPTVGVRASGCVVVGPGAMFAPGALDDASDEMSSANHLNGPSSRYLADLKWSSGADPDILVDHSLAAANVSVIMPADNVSNGGVRSIALSPLSERWVLDDTGGALNWWITLSVGDDLSGSYVWRARVARSGASTVLTGILQIDTGGGFIDVPGTESFPIILATATQEIQSSIAARINFGDRVRMMFRTSVPATGTLVSEFTLDAQGTP